MQRLPPKYAAITTGERNCGGECWQTTSDARPRLASPTGPIGAHVAHGGGRVARAAAFPLAHGPRFVMRRRRANTGCGGFLRGGWLVTTPSLEVRKEKRQSNRRRLEETGGTAGSAGESRGALGRQDRPPRSRAESDECRGVRARPRLISDCCSRDQKSLLYEGRREGELREGMGELRANLHLFF